MPEVPVVVLPTNPDTRPARSHVMGSVVAAQEPTRCVWIYLAAIWGTLSSHLGARSGEVRPYLFHLALARVVAHEVVRASHPTNRTPPGGSCARDSIGNR